MAIETAPILAAARRVKGKVVMCCPSDGTGMKTRAMRLAEAHNGRYSRRSCGYIMTPSSAIKALELWRQGYDAHLRIFADDKRRAKDLLIPPPESTS